MAIISVMLNFANKYLAALWAAATALAGIYAIWRPSGKPMTVGRIGGAVIGIVATLLSLGFIVQPSEAERLAALRKSDPVAYLAAIEKTDQTLWMKELDGLDPTSFAIEKQRLDQEAADKAKADEAARIAAEQAAVADAAAKKEERAASFATLKASTLSAVENLAWPQALSQVVTARNSFVEEYGAAKPEL